MSQTHHRNTAVPPLKGMVQKIGTTIGRCRKTRGHFSNTEDARKSARYEALGMKCASTRKAQTG